MDIIGIIAEYNPFHNGHLYHINKIKELYKDSILIAVISTSFCQRGEISILNKWDKTKICLENNIDIVIELPFIYSSQSADIFAKGAIKILNEMKVNKIIFGSESNNIDKLKEIAIKQTKDNIDIKKYLKQGLNYPTALAKTINCDINTPNDLLAISYIKEIIKNNYNIEPITIKRTNNYHDLTTKSNIISASAIRNLIKNNKSIKKYVPKNTYKYIYKNTDYYNLLKYKIISDINILNNYQTVDEGIEGRIKKYINQSNTKEELIKNIKTKRYTYNKINRMLTHILTSTTKEEAKLEPSYIRILGFNNKGKEYLNKIKKKTNLKIITNYKNIDDKVLNIEYRITSIYQHITNDNSLIKKELEKPIIIK